MRIGDVYAIDFLDHAELGGPTAWTETADLDMQAPLVRVVGFVVKHSKQAVAISVSCSDGQTTSPFLVLKSTIINAAKLSLPPKRRKPSGTKDA